MIQMQKVIKVGNSLAMTLDSKQAALMNIKVGQKLAVSYKPDNHIFSVGATGASIDSKAMKKAEKEANVASKVTPEFQMWVEKSLDEDAEAMSKLASL